MKLVSIFFSVILLFSIANFSLHIFQLYDSKGPLKSFGVDQALIATMARPSLILLVIYVIALITAIFLNVKKKYIANTIFLSAMIVIYMAVTFFGVV